MTDTEICALIARCKAGHRAAKTGYERRQWDRVIRELRALL